MPRDCTSPFFKLVEHLEHLVAVDREARIELVVRRVVDSDDAAVPGHERPAGSAATNSCIVLDRVAQRRPGVLLRPIGARHEPFGQREVRSARREAGRGDLERVRDLAVVPAQQREVLAVHLQHREVEALGRTHQLGAELLARVAADRRP